MIRTIAVVGFGRFGKLMARLLEPFGEVVVSGRSDCRDEASRQQLRWVPLAEAGQRDAVMLCVPISAIGAAAREIRPHLRPGSLVLDTCSVKVQPMRLLTEILPPGISLLGTHPMFGPDSIKSGLAGKQVVHCPVRLSDEQLATVEGWWRTLGLEIITVSPDEHDRQVALSQGLVHLIGRAVATMEIPHPRITTENFDRLWAIRESVGNDTWQLFVDLETQNPYAEEVRNVFCEAARALVKRLAEVESGPTPGPD